MITFSLGLGKGECLNFEFKTFKDFIEFVPESLNYSTRPIWLATSKGEYSEIIITDNFDKIILSLYFDNWPELSENKDSYFFLQEYESFEDAYNVALSMREGHKFCYNK